VPGAEYSRLGNSGQWRRCAGFQPVFIAAVRLHGRAVNFTGTILVTDVLGPNGNGITYGVAVWDPPMPRRRCWAGIWMSSSLRNYQTVPTINAPFREFNNGFCNAAATGTPSGVAATLGVNGLYMPVMGAGFANCSPFSYAGGRSIQHWRPHEHDRFGAVLLFTAGGAGQAIDLPWGEDFPDRRITRKSSIRAISAVSPTSRRPLLNR